jgi:DNA polymerase III subunit epsilon
MDFVTIDIETANADLSSICQIGIASFLDGVVVDSWETLVNPEDDFDPMNVMIHGITEATVRTSPTWPRIHGKVIELLSQRITVSHTPFDRVAFHRVCEKYREAECPCQWLDSARVTRRAWSQFAYSGYSLANVAEQFGIVYKAHPSWW